MQKYDELDTPPRSRPRHVVYVGRGPRVSDPHEMSMEDYGLVEDDEPPEETEDADGNSY